MQADSIAAGVEELRSMFGDRVRMAMEGQRTLVIVSGVELPSGCRPQSTDVLLALDPGQPKPVHYVRPGQTLRNGQHPKNPTPTMVGGEAWMNFSWDFPYKEGDPLSRFVAMIQQRFAKNE
jgi:hypothetical protein